MPKTASYQNLPVSLILNKNGKLSEMNLSFYLTMKQRNLPVKKAFHS